MAPTVTFISRYYPPSPNINGESVWDMVKYLSEQYGMESNVICIDRSFEGGGNQRQPIGHIIPLKTPYQGKNAILRFITFLYDGFVLIRKALKYRNTFIVCTTSPPLLPMWASLLFGKKIKWALWTFDLFPEGFQATRLIRTKNPLFKLAFNYTYKNPPSYLIALGPRQAEHIQQKYKARIPTVILPCGVFFYQDKSDTKPDWWEPNKIFIGYCGNIGDAHNPEFVRAFIDHLDTRRYRLVLALYGNQAPALKEYAREKEGVILVNTVPRSQLHFIDLHLVSLRREWTHIAVPSKAISAVTMGSCIVFCGSPDSDNWHMLQEAGWFIDEEEPLTPQVRHLLDTLTIDAIKARKSKTPAIYERLKAYVTDAYASVRDIAGAASGQ